MKKLLFIMLKRDWRADKEKNREIGRLTLIIVKSIQNKSKGRMHILVNTNLNAKNTRGGRVMRVKDTLYKNVLFISLIGELDQHNADLIRQELETIIAETEAKKVVFDLKELEFMDSSGIGVLLGRYKKLLAKKIPVFITNSNKHVDRVLMMSGIYKLMPKIDASNLRKEGTK